MLVRSPCLGFSRCWVMPCMDNNRRPSTEVVKHLKLPSFEEARAQISRFWPIYTPNLVMCRPWEFTKHPNPSHLS
jgi:hypothetical protein